MTSSPPSRAPPRASGSSARCRSAPTRCASSPASSPRVLITEKRWVARGGAPGDVARHRRLGGAVRHHRRPDLPRDLQPARLLRRGRRPAAGLRHLGGRPRHLGRHRLRRGRRLDRLPPPRHPAAGVRRRARARAAGRPGDRPARQLVQQRALRRARPTCPGRCGSTSGTAAGAVLGADGQPVVLGTFHPTFLYELLWNLARRGRRRLGRPAVPARPRPGVRAVRRHLLPGRLWIELLRTDPAETFFGVRLNVFTSVVVGLLRRRLLRWQRGRPREVIDRGARRPTAATADAGGRCPTDGGRRRRPRTTSPSPRRRRP